jgi:hypothetical protein
MPGNRTGMNAAATGAPRSGSGAARCTPVRSSGGWTAAGCGWLQTRRWGARLPTSAFPSHERVEVVPVAAARRQLRAIVKHYKVLAAEERFHGLNAIDVHDG